MVLIDYIGIFLHVAILLEWRRRKSGEGNKHLNAIDRFQGKNE
jgi:hypothetical protein